MFSVLPLLVLTVEGNVPPSPDLGGDATILLLTPMDCPLGLAYRLTGDCHISRNVSLAAKATSSTHLFLPPEC